jgi:hypothetical protein
MSTSQARIDKLPKQFPFSKRGKEMIPKRFDLGYHVTVLGKYSKKMPKREPSALDLRNYQNPMKFWSDTTKFDPNYYKAH